MRKFILTFAVLMLGFVLQIQAATTSHVITFGKSTIVKFFVGPNESKAVDMKVRPLYVDGKLKEFTTGESHDITEQEFVVQRAYRVNDSLPQDERVRWKWQRGGWLLANRSTGRVAPLRLPEFDPFQSDIAWYRDIAAYCGISDTGEKLYAVVVQIGARRPVLLKFLRPITGASLTPECGRPVWQRQPARITFDFKDGQKMVFTLHGHIADPTLPDETPDEE
jgi:hypothetical protein